MSLAALPTPTFTGADLSVRTNAVLLEARAARRFATVAALLADAAMAYGTGSRPVAAIDAIEAGGHRYQVAASGATDHQLTTAGGVKLYVRPGPDGVHSFAAMNPAADGVTNDYAKLRALLDAVATGGSAMYKSGPSVFLPNGTYFIGQTIEINTATRLWGNSSGMAYDSGPSLIFPTDTVGITINRHNTRGGTTATSGTAADSTILEGIKLYSTVGTDTTKHGIWMRARAVIRNCFVSNFSGSGLCIAAAAGAGGAAEGNANCFRVEGGRFEGCEHGILATGPDANAGTIIGVDASGNRRWGFWDNSLLGNAWIGCHAEANGLHGATGRSAYALFGGAYYHAVPAATETQLRTTTPGTNTAVWRQCGTTAFAIAWTGSNPVGTYRPGGGYHSDNANCRATFVGCYVEGSQGLTWFSQHTLSLGGMWIECPIVSGGHIQGEFGPKVERMASAHAAGAHQIFSNLGDVEGSRAAFTWSSTADPLGTWALREQNGEWQIGTQAGNAGGNAITMTAPSGWGGAVHSVIQRLAIGDIDQNGPRRLLLRDAVPTTGAWDRGDRVLARNPSTGGPEGWICTATGTPGTWRPFGLVHDPAETTKFLRGDGTLADPAAQPASINAQVGSAYTLVLGDAGDAVTMTNAGANVVTVPANATAAFPVGTEIAVLQLGAGATTIAGATGVTVNGSVAGSVAVSAQWAGRVLLKTAADTWVVS